MDWEPATLGEGRKMKDGWNNRLIKAGVAFIAAASAFETLSDLPGKIAQDKHFFSIVGFLLLEVVFYLFFWLVPIGLMVFALIAIDFIIRWLVSLLTSKGTKRLWLSRTHTWGRAIAGGSIVAVLGYFAVISHGHPFSEINYRIVNWNRDQEMQRRERDREQSVRDCMAASHSEKEKYDCQFDVPP
jgi:hypothetical protein